MTKVGFLGFGQMATAICEGFIYKGIVNPADMCATARDKDKLKANCESRGITAMDTAASVAEASDVVIVAVIPGQVKPVLEGIKDLLSGKIVVSIAWGCDCDFLNGILPDGVGHISTIPNTPIAVGEGIVITEKKHTLTETQFGLFKDLFEPVSLLVYTDTENFLTGGSMAGCTTAFAAMMIEALGDAGVKWGLTRQTSYNIVSKMIAGVGRLQLETGDHPGVMKDRICSPGGTTIIGVEALEEAGFRYALQHAIDEIMERQ